MADAPRDFEQLLADCIDLVESGEVDRAELLLADYPEHANRVRSMLASLVGMGMVDDETATGAPSDMPTSLGKYRILGEIARGGQGVVYRAEDTELARRVAIKVLQRSFVDSAGLTARFRREATVASRLDHPGICTVFEASIDDGVPFIAMEYLEGPTLAEQIRRCRDAGERHLTEAPPDEAAPRSPSSTSRGADRALEIVEAIARAAHAAHEASIVHRDIKPSNVILTKARGPVLTDFGLARDDDSERDGLTRTGDVFGTPEYMAPEQIERETAPADARTDVWALGVTLFECVTLRRPFEAQTRSGLYRAILEDPAPDPRTHVPSLTRDLSIVVARALDKDRVHRYRSAAEFADDLHRIRAFEPIRARPAGAGLRVRRWAQRNPGVAASLVAVFTILVLALGISLAFLDSRNEALARYTSMADVTLVRQLLEEEPSLWPRREARLADMNDWLRRTNEALGREEQHRAELARIPETPDADSLESRWRAETLTELLASIDPLRTARDAVVARIHKTREIRRATLDDAAGLWQRCLADITANTQYARLQLEPQIGLVPLGRDADSKLWEFWLYESGARPQWDGTEASGKAKVSDESGVILVLVPAGSAWMGAQSEDPSARGYCVGAHPTESPVREVRVEAFFVSKHEITQAQWARVTGANPSYHTAGGAPPGQLLATTEHNPVEHLDWRDATDGLARLALQLPTEAQWEYAARAGSESLWTTGDEPVDLNGHANIADATASRITQWRCSTEIDDGFVAHAPVGTFAANGFGLHDTAGNVWEWCRDEWTLDPDQVPHASEWAPGQGEHIRLRALRGGSFFRPVDFCRTAKRWGSPEGEAAHDVGVRAVREID